MKDCLRSALRHSRKQSHIRCPEWRGCGTISLRLSIVIPVYNEEKSVQPLYRSIQKACDPLGRAYEMIFVDDGSQDGTFGILETIHRQDARVKVVRLRKNFGQTAAMTAGFAYAKGDVIISMDGDLQNDPADIPRLLSKLEEGFDVVCGWREHRQDKLLSRRVPSVVANWLIGRMTGVQIHDNGCSLKAYQASVIKNVALYGDMHRFIPALSTLAGARISRDHGDPSFTAIWQEQVWPRSYLEGCAGYRHGENAHQLCLTSRTLVRAVESPLGDLGGGDLGGWRRVVHLRPHRGMDGAVHHGLPASLSG